MIGFDQKLPLQVSYHPDDDRAFIPVPHLEPGNLRDYHVNYRDDALAIVLVYPAANKVRFDFEADEDQKEALADRQVVPVGQKKYKEVFQNE